MTHIRHKNSFRFRLLAGGCLLALTAFAGPALADSDAAATIAADTANQGSDQGTAIPGATLAASVTLREAPTVYTDVVKLGDVFQNTGASADTVLGRAPLAGQALVLNANTLARIARNAGLNWRPDNLGTHSVITRASQHVTTENLADAVSRSVAEQSGEANWAIEFDRRNIDMQLPIDADSPPTAKISVDRLDFDAAQGQFYAEITLLSAPGKDPVHLSLSGRALQQIKLPVLVRPVPEKGIIKAEDIDWKSWPKGTLLSDTLTDSNDLIGHEAVRSLPVGQPIRKEYVEEERVIKAGDLVTMVYQTPYMRVATQGRALDEGAVGQTVRVMNTQSSRTIEATIVASGEVTVKQN